MRFHLMLYIALLAMTLTFRSGPTAGESAEPIDIMVGGNNPPFSFALPDGSAAGLYVEFWELWSQTNDVPVNIVLTNIEQGLEAARQDNKVFGGLFINAERRQWADFSDPIHSVKTSVLYSRDYAGDRDLAQMDGLRVSVQRLSFQADFLQNNYPDLELSLHSRLDTAIGELLHGDIQAIVAEVPNLSSEMSRLGLNGLLTIADEDLMNNTVHALFAQGQPELKQTLDEGIANIPIDKIIELEKKWLPSVPPFFKPAPSVPNLTSAEKAWLQAHSRFRLGVDGSWYPFEFRDSNGAFSGIAANYVQYVNKSLGIELDPVHSMPWREAFAALKDGNMDVMSAAIATRDRLRSVDFTDPYFEAPTAIVIRSDTFYADSMRDLSGKKLGLVKGFAIVEFVARDYPDIQIELLDSIVEGLEKLQSGEIDAYIGALAVINYEISRRNLPDLIIAGFTPYKFEISMAVRKGLEPLTGILNKTFAGMDERQRARIANDWLSIHVQTGTGLGTILAWSLPILFLLLCIISVIVLFNRRLQREIASRKEAEEELKHLAQHDVLTGLPNRRLFDELSHAELLRAAREKNTQAVLFLDIDSFKEVNDTLGHKAGDSLLVSIAQRFKQCIRDSDIIARIGGDEFLIHLCSDCSEQDAAAIASKILEAMSEPFQLETSTQQIGTSIGIAMFPTDANDVSGLVQHADSAMYAAKLSGKNTYALASQGRTSS